MRAQRDVSVPINRTLKTNDLMDTIYYFLLIMECLKLDKNDKVIKIIKGTKYQIISKFPK